MTAPVVDRSVTAVAELMLGCYAEAIGKVTNPPKVVSLRPGGEIQLLMSKLRDECCEGLGWVRVAGVYPSSDFPQPDIVYQNCAPYQFAAVLELGAARCAPIGTINNLPTAAQWTAVTHATLADKAAMRRAICCFATLEEDRMWMMGTWTPLTVEGGCVGSTQLVTVAVDDLDCLPE